MSKKFYFPNVNLGSHKLSYKGLSYELKIMNSNYCVWFIYLEGVKPSLGVMP